MFTLVAIGLVGGLITGISPCILPVLPVIFFSGAQGVRVSDGDGTVATEAPPTRALKVRPYLVIAGLVLSFSIVTLLGSALLSLLHLPQDTVRWVALLALVAIGLGLIFPEVEAVLEKPFARLPQKQFGSGRNGFGLGLALGVLYVPCAGPVLAAIVVAGATGTIGVNTVALTLAFAVGAALPLLFFALAGRRVAERVAAFRSRQRQIRIIAGIVTILLALALVFNLPAVLQRAIPDYTGTLQDEVGGAEQLQKLNLGGLVNDQNAQLSNCSSGGKELESCGTAPDIKGITTWLNTPGGTPIDLKSLRGRVVLIDFWAYSCINCQRAIPHVVGWYDAYRDKGFEVIGVHSPEYGFEKVDTNVASGAADLNIEYPIALDNNLSTWTNYRNRYWPAEYLIDAQGTVRHVTFGEGDYDDMESLIRQLLSDANNDVDLPPATEGRDTTPTSPTTPETYFSVGNVVNYGGRGVYDQGEATFALPAQLAADSFALGGRWALDDQGATAVDDGATIALNGSDSGQWPAQHEADHRRRR
jgi:cytochrome c biogenesis protein CcdA/thiol-disulfide isomerase/thioredoxin